MGRGERRRTSVPVSLPAQAAWDGRTAGVGVVRPSSGSQGGQSPGGIHCCGPAVARPTRPSSLTRSCPSPYRRPSDRSL